MKEAMHVGVFLGDFRADVGGGYTFAHDVVESFLEVATGSSYHFSVFCRPDYAERLRREGLPSNVQAVGIPPRGFLELRIAALRHYAPVFGYVWKRPCRLERSARKLSVDLMWFVGGFYDTLDMPYVATVWDMQHLTHPWFPEVSINWQWDYRELFLARYLRRATYVITGTEVGQGELIHFYRLPSERIRILPHPTPAFARRATNETGLSNADICGRYKLAPHYLLYPAQFWPHKNHVNLLLALKELIAQGGDVPDLALAGSDKGNRVFVEQYAADLGVAHKVRFLGFVPVDELASLYRYARAMVYPSFTGPENLPPLEAFALGCPVVASDFPGAREQLGDAALFFDPADPVAIAGAIQRILSDHELRRSLIKRGFSRAVRWTGHDYVRGVFAILDEFEPIRRCWSAT